MVIEEKLNNIISKISGRNNEIGIGEPQGINIDKYFMPSVANINGVDLSKYKVVGKNQFACNRMHVGRDERLPIALNTGTPIIVSPAYDVFEICKPDIILPEYLMLFFRTKRFDKLCWFYTDADVRGALVSDAFYNDIIIPIPELSEQKKAIDDYNLLTKEIKLIEKIIDKNETLLINIYKKTFNEQQNSCTLSDLVDIVYGKGLPKTELSSENKGYPVYGANGIIGYYSKYNVEEPKVLVSCRGTVGNINTAQAYSYVTSNSLILNPKDCISFEWLKYFSIARGGFADFQSGSVQAQITVEQLNKCEAYFPDKESLNSFTKKAKVIENYNSNLMEQKRRIEEFRDGLINHIFMISGRNS